MASSNYQVIVGNIGTVYNGHSGKRAVSTFLHYVLESERKIGRAAGEPVTLMRDSEPIREYLGTVTIDDGEESADTFGI
jgi:hypothetical protein